MSVFQKSRAITPSKIDQSKKKMNRHDPSIVVHIYFKFHEILPASDCEMAVNVHF